MSYDPGPYWEKRYAQLNLHSSGHRDLPALYNDWLYHRKRRVLRRSLARCGLKPADLNILEVGSGTGAYLDFWRGEGVTALTGLDLSAAAVEFIGGQYPEYRFMQRDVTAPGLAADCGTGFDLVTALDVLYHVVDDQLLATALENIHAVLRPGGILAVHDQFLHRETEHHDYIRWRSLADWEQALDAAGFDIIGRTPIFFLMIQPTDIAPSRTGVFMDRLWVWTNRCIHRAPALMARLLFAADSLLGMMLREGPSMELLLARRRP